MALPVKVILRMAALALGSFVVYIALFAGLPMNVSIGLFLGAVIGGGLAVHPNSRVQAIGFAIVAVAFGAALTLPLMVIVGIVVVFLLLGVMN